jgi:hypothetical protein
MKIYIFAYVQECRHSGGVLMVAERMKAHSGSGSVHACKLIMLACHVCWWQTVRVAGMQMVAGKDSERMAHWLIEPCDPERFRSSIAERKALLLTRPHARDRNKGCFNVNDVWDLLEHRQLRYGLNVDVTLYTKDRQRETFNYNHQASDGIQVRPHRSPVDFSTRSSKENQFVVNPIALTHNIEQGHQMIGVVASFAAECLLDVESSWKVV